MPSRKPAVHRAALLVVTAWAASAGAHGPAAAITGVAAARGGVPTVIQVSEGLAVAEGTGFRYVCPTQFGNELSPPALSLDGASTFVVGAEDLYTLATDGTVAATHRPEFSRHTVLTLSAVSGRLYGFVFAGGETRIVQIEPPLSAPLWTDARPYDSLSAEGDGFWMGRAEGAIGHAMHVDLGGSAAPERTFPIEGGSMVARVVAAGDDLYVALITGDLAGRLLTIGPDGGAAVLTANAPLQGPVVLDGGAVVAGVDGALESLGAGAPVALGSSVATCIGRSPGLSFLCSRTKLSSLGPSGPEALLADLAGLAPPDLDRVAPDLRDACTLQWKVFQADLRAVGVTTGAADGGTPHPEGGRESPPPTPPKSAGCAIAIAMSSESTHPVARTVALWGALVSLRRRRVLRATRARPSNHQSRRHTV